MKKLFLLIPLTGLMLSCSGGSDKSAESQAAMQEQTENIEQSIQKLDETIQSAEEVIQNAQNEIDKLLDEI